MKLDHYGRWSIFQEAYHSVHYRYGPYEYIVKERSLWRRKLRQLVAQ